MRFDHLKNPAACAAKESSRYAINGAAIVKLGDRHYIAATDGHCLTCIPCELEEGDHPDGVYPPAAFDAYRKACRTGKASLAVNGKAELRTMDGQSSAWPAAELRFPDVGGVITGKMPKGQRITINAKLLAKMADAFGTEAVTLHLAMGSDGIESSAPLRIEPTLYGAVAKRQKRQSAENDGSFGMLMLISEA